MKGSLSRRGRGGADRAGRQRRRRHLAREERLIERRLRAAVVPNLSGPVLGRSRATYEMAERSGGVAHGGWD